MDTIIYRLADLDREENLERAANLLRNGGLVAFPTETVYGLGAAITHPDSINRIFEVKGRPNDNPLIVHIPSAEQLRDLVTDVPPVAWRLAELFWPGPLTLVLPSNGVVPNEVTAGLTTVGIRVPNHPVALQLLKRTGIPVAAPSANLSGRPSPTKGEDVAEDLAGKVEMILDAGPTGVGVESTVLDLTSDIPRVLRPGGVTKEMLETVFGVGRVETSWKIESDKPSAPGMKYRHYAPKAPLKVYTGDAEGMKCVIRSEVERLLNENKRVAVLSFDDHKGAFPGAIFLSLGRRTDAQEPARRLFQLLRECDRLEVDRILGESPAIEGIGLAVMNRLWKAAGGDVIAV
jgi:L-threonylcarbamoyladenylate synthase